MKPTTSKEDIGKEDNLLYHIILRLLKESKDGLYIRKVVGHPPDTFEIFSDLLFCAPETFYLYGTTFGCTFHSADVHDPDSFDICTKAIKYHMKNCQIRSLPAIDTERRRRLPDMAKRSKSSIGTVCINCPFVRHERDASPNGRVHGSHP